jgi:hypothetical protein
VFTGTLDASRLKMTVRASVAPLLTASTLGRSVALGIVIRPANNYVVDRLYVAQLACCHRPLCEAQDVIVVIHEFRVSDLHGLDVIRDDSMITESFLETQQNFASRLWNRPGAFDAAFQKCLVPVSCHLFLMVGTR